MPEITEEEFTKQMEGILPEKRRAAMEKLKANGYTIKGAQPATPAPQSKAPIEDFRPSLNPLSPPSDFAPSTRALPPGGEMRAADPMQRAMLSLPGGLARAFEPGQTGMNRNIIGSALDIATGGGPGGSAELSPIAGQALGVPKWATTMNLGTEKMALTPAEITQKPFFAAIERAMHNIPFSANVMQRWNQIRNAAVMTYRDGLLARTGPEMEREGLGAMTQEALESHLEQSEKARQTGLGAARDKALLPGKTTTPEAVGEAMQSGVSKAKEVTRKQAGRLYKDIGRDMPPELSLFDARELRAKAKQLLETRGSAPSTLPAGVEDDLRRIMEAPQGLSWQKLHELQSDYGKQAADMFRSPSGDRVKGKIYSELQEAARAAMARRAKEIGGKTWDQYQFATAFYKKYKDTYDTDAINKFLKVYPSEVYKTFIQNGSPEEIRELSKVARPEDFQNIRKMFVEDIVGAKGDAIPSTADIAQKLNKYKYKLGEILTPAQSEQVTKFAKTGEMPQFIQSEVEKNLGRIARKSPSQIYETVMRGDPTITRTIKNVVGSQQWKMYQRKFVEKLIGESGADLFTGDKIGKNIGGLDPEYRRLFVSDADMAGIQKLQLAKQRMDTGEKLWGNSSGTARNLISFSMMGMILHNPVTGVPIALSAPVVAKFYLSPEGRNLLVNGLNASKVSAAAIYPKIAAFALNMARQVHEEDQKYWGIVQGGKPGASTAPSASPQAMLGQAVR